MFVVLTYAAAIAAANLIVAALGPWVSPINAFLLIGLDLALRDQLHDRWAGRYLWPRMFALIAGAGLVSYLLNPAAAQIAIASVAAFVSASLADAAAYQLLIRRSYLQRSNASNAVGALVDSLVFPLAAGFSLAWAPVQFGAKLAGGAVWAYLLWRLATRRAAA